MPTHYNSSKENKADTTVERSAGKERSKQQFNDNRPAAGAQRKLQAMADSRPGAQEALQLQSVIHNSIAGVLNREKAPLQKQADAPSITSMPVIQRQPSYNVENDDSIIDLGAIRTKWRAIVVSCLEAVSDTTPAMNELIDELMTGELDIEFILANQESHIQTAGGKTSNPDMPAVYNPLLPHEGRVNVKKYTAVPGKTLQIKIFKQDKKGGTEIPAKYGISVADIHGIIIHELVMHGLPHYRMIKERSELQNRPETIDFTVEALNENEIPKLVTLHKGIVAAKDHKDLDLWKEKAAVSLKYQSNDQVSKAQVFIKHVDDVFEHIGMQNMDNDTRKGLVKHLIQTWPGAVLELPDDSKAVIDKIIDNISFLENDIANSVRYGYPMNDHIKKVVRKKLTPLKKEMHTLIIQALKIARRQTIDEYKQELFNTEGIVLIGTPLALSDVLNVVDDEIRRRESEL
jgi:hypothetical protein